MSRFHHRLLIFFVILLACGIFTALRFPGEMNPDSQSQFEQAMIGVYNDWHPPIMARLWSFFMLFSGGVWTMFVFQMLCWALAFAILALALERRGHQVAAWAAVVVALFPPFLMHIVNIHKDVGLIATLMLAVALIAQYRLQGKKIPLLVRVIVAALLLYAGLVRSNSWFAVMPILVWILWPSLLKRPIGVALACGIVAVALVPVSSLINQSVLDARPAGALRTLQIFDLAGVVKFSRDTTVAQDKVTLAQIDECYSPVIADIFYHGARCGFLWDAIAGSADTPAGLATEQPNTRQSPSVSLTPLWIAAIRKHPLAYAEHRLGHFNAAMQFLIPGHEASVPAIHAVVAGKPAERLEPLRGVRKILDLMRFGPWATPAVWLALGLALLLLSHDAARRMDEVDTLSLALTLSGASYIGAFLLIGIANDPRYGLAGGVAIVTAAAMQLRRARPVASSRPVRIGIAIALLIFIVAAMTFYRTSVPDALYLASNWTIRPVPSMIS